MPVQTLNCELSDLVLYLYKDTIIPELFELLGDRKAMIFLQVFGDTKMKVPSYSKVLDLERNIEIYETLSYAYSDDAIKTLADNYEVTEVWVKKVYNVMKRKYGEIVDFINKSKETKKLNITSRRNERTVYDGGRIERESEKADENIGIGFESEVEPEKEDSEASQLDQEPVPTD